MREGLQTVQRHAGTNEEVIQPTKLLIDREYARIAADFVRGAKSEIRLCAYAWRWYENEPEIDIQKLNIELLLAKGRGVKVRALVDTAAMAEKFKAIGFDCRSVINTRMLHTKAIEIDGKTIMIGSHNMTKRATTDNYEMSILSQEYYVVAVFQEYFDTIWTSRG